MQQFFKDRIKDNPQFAESLRKLFLQVIDRLWVNHLESMDFLRTSVGLKSYGQQEPIVEYKKEGLLQFKALEELIDRNTANVLTKMVTQVEEYEAEQAALSRVQQEADVARANSANSNSGNAQTNTKEPVVNNQSDLIGRNDLVTVTNGSEQRTLKYKKAETLLAEGWKLVNSKN